MKYYSDVTKQFYNTSDDCIKAEEEALNKQVKERQEKEKLAAERKNHAAKVEKARKNMVAAQNEYRKVLEEFIKQYGSYHYSSSDVDDIPTLFNFFKIF